MDYSNFMRAAMPYEAIAHQQRYARAYRPAPHGQHPAYPGYAVDGRTFVTLAHLHNPQQHPHGHHTAGVMGQGDPNRGPQRQTEPKPRLAKDEVELLEAEFAKNPKPNSSTKRDLAERMGVDVARINNWFQNWRAKAKLQLKEQQARDRAASGGSDSLEDPDAAASREPFPTDARRTSVNLSTAAFPSDISEDSTAETGESDSELGRPEPALESEPAVNESSLQQFPSESHVFTHITYASPESFFTNAGNPEGSLPAIAHEFPISQPQGTPQMVLSPFMTVQGSAPPMQLAQPAPVLEHIAVSAEEAAALVVLDHRMPSEIELHHAASFPSEFLSQAAIDEGILAHERESMNQLQQSAEMPEAVKAEHLSPVSMSQSPPSPADPLRFKSPPPPTNIANRRNIRRPAPLWLSSSTSPTIGYGPKTCVEPSRPSPMRRIASATGTLSGRIQKPLSASAPRSPFNREAFIQSLQGVRSPIMDSVVGAPSPRQPESRTRSPQPTREATVSSCTSDEDHMYILNSAHVPLQEQHAVKTPPLTPGFHPTNFEAVFPYGVQGTLGFPHDDSCLTPGLISNGSDFEMSIAAPGPGYACASQPPTPSFTGHSSMGPAFWGSLSGTAGPANVEYNFPDSYPELAGGHVSPGPMKATKQFQFTQNVTPQDFHLPK